MGNKIRGIRRKKNGWIESNILKYIHGDQKSGGLKPTERYASFDYCFNYFQSFRESGTVKDISHEKNIQESCLQLGFYLASWGMFRGSSTLLQKSLKIFEPVIGVIASTDEDIWEIDADCYTPDNIEKIIEFEKLIQRTWSAYKLPGPSPTLVTKIMLGVFGNVPAFDNYFRKGFGSSRFNSNLLNRIGQFYRDNSTIIEKYRINTLDFLSGKPTKRRYSRAKVIDMVFFIEGRG